MRICFVIGTLQYSGAEKIMRHLISELYSRGYEISIILMSCSEVYDDFSYINQYPIYNSVDEKTTNKFLRVLKRITRIRKVLKKNEFDVFISFGVKFNLDVILACLGLKTPLIICERNDPKNDPKSKILKMRRSIFYPLANGFVFQTQEIKQYFSRKIQNKSVVIPNFLEKKIDKSEMLKLRKKAFVTSARLDDNQKNQTMLIESFSEFLKQNNDYILEIYGEGPDKNKYQKKINKLNLENRVFLKGMINDPMVEISTCEIFILSSNYEGMPNSLIEAMAYGMPCISTNCSGGGAASLIEDNVNGVLIPVGDKNALVNAMIKTSKDIEFREKIGCEAYKINETLKMSRIIDIWEETINRIGKKNK
jgi:glycosyltransferase involved in cell wall biosynthesis